MKRILTAINNPNLNEKLSQEKSIEIIGKDIQYREAIIDILEKEKNIDIIIINNEIPGEINNEELINKIREINSNIKIIFILEKENKKIENILRQNNIDDIYYNSEISIKILIQIIKKNYINSEEEIKKELEELRKIVIENNLDYKQNNISSKNNIQNIKLIKIIKNKLINKLTKNNLNKKGKNNSKNIFNEKEKNNFNKKIKNNFKKYFNREKTNINYNDKDKIITISGPPNVGKTTFLINMSKVIKDKKILLIDFDINNQNIYNFLGIKKYSKFIIKNNLLKQNEKINNLLKENKNNNYKIKEIFNYFIINIDKNINLISGINLISNFLNSCIQEELNKIIFEFFQLLKKEYDLILIDIGVNNNFKINKILYENSDINLLLLEANLIGIIKLKNFLEKNKFNNFKLIINKNDNFCIDKKILNNIFNFDIIGHLNYRRIYNKFLNKNYRSIKIEFNKEFKLLCNKLNI